MVRSQYSGNAHGLVKGLGIVTCLYYHFNLIFNIQLRPLLSRFRLGERPGESALVLVSMLYDLFDRCFEDIFGSQSFSHPLRLEAVDLKLR